MRADWVNQLVLLIAGASLGMAIVCILMLFTQSRPIKKENLMLCLGLCCFSATAILNALAYSDFLRQYPHWLRVAFPLHYAAAPFFYLYLRGKLTPQQYWPKLVWLHFLPAFLHLLEFIPFYLQPASYKLQLLDDFARNSNALTRQAEGLLPPYWHPYIKLSLGIVYQVASLRLLQRYQQQVAPISAVAQTGLKWLRLLVFALLAYYACTLLVVIGPKQAAWFGWVANLGILAFLVCCVLLMVIKPRFMLGRVFSKPALKMGTSPVLSSLSPEPTGVTKATEETTIHYSKPAPEKKVLVSPAEREALLQQINQLFADAKPFLQANYTLPQLATQVNVSVHKLSYLLNREITSGFNDFVNVARIDYLLEHIQHPEWQRLTLEAMAYKSGFASRSTFIKAFKQYKGVTPSVYLQGLKTKPPSP